MKHIMRIALAACLLCATVFTGCISVSLAEYIYTVTVAGDTEHGTVTASKTSEISAYEKISLSVAPANGYELDTLTVTSEADGKEIAVKDNEFKMPKGNAIVTVTYSPCAETKSKATAVGDVVLNDGTFVAYENISKMTEKQKAKAIAVIFYMGTDCSNNGEIRTLGVGLFHSDRYWALDTANARKMLISTIQSKPSGSKGNYTFTGDKNGSDNLQQIATYLNLANDTTTASNYPAFYFAKNYKDFKIWEQVSDSVLGNVFGKGNYRDKGTNVTDLHKDGWYLPSIAEVFQLYKNKDKVEEASTLCGGSKFNTDKGIGYLSSSMDEEKGSIRYLELSFSTGECIGIDTKHGSVYHHGAVCAIRAF